MRSTAIALLLCCACGRDPELACDDLARTTCERSVACMHGEPTDADKAAQLNACVKDTRAILFCGNATGVGPKYDRCMSETKAISCDEMWASSDMGKGWAPASCVAGQAIEVEGLNK